jgi:hypothetical protein
MKECPKHKVDVNSAGRKLEQLCNWFIWSGIALVAFSQIGMMSLHSTIIAVPKAVFYFFFAIGFVGLGLVLCGAFMWRLIYGLFPSVILPRDPGLIR